MDMFQEVISRVKHYCDNSSIHGLRFITEPSRHWTERVFWAVVCITANWLLYLLIKASIYNFNYNSISFVVDTSYLNWNTTLPAISLCELQNFERINAINRRDPTINGLYTNEAFLSDTVYFDGVCPACQYCYESDCPDIRLIDRKFKTPCEELFKNCSWLGKSFNCCSQFLPLQTELGICYTINSVHTTPVNGSKKMDLITNLKTGLGVLTVALDPPERPFIQIFLHPPDGVPFLNHPIQDKVDVLSKNKLYTTALSITEIINDDEVKTLPIWKRNCRFPYESNLRMYKYYSYSTCVTECRYRKQLQLCNCTNHLMPTMDGINSCDWQGLNCITNHSKNLNQLKRIDESRDGLSCDCLTSCIEPEYSLINLEAKLPKIANASNQNFIIRMTDHPHRRFKRRVVRTILDLVVSAGGAAGLFLGASLLSSVELIYFIFIRKTNYYGNDNDMNSVNNIAVPASPGGR